MPFETLLTFGRLFWEKTSNVSDWRNYVDDDMRGLWSQLTERERLIAFLIAQEAASTENWE